MGTEPPIWGFLGPPNRWLKCVLLYWCPLKLFFAAEKIRLNPVAEVQPFSLPLFSPQKPGNMNKDEQRYTFYRTAVVWSAD